MKMSNSLFRTNYHGIDAKLPAFSAEIFFRAALPEQEVGVIYRCKKGLI